MNGVTNLSLGLSVSANIELEKTDRLLRVFEEIHNCIYANDGLSSQQVFEEMLKVLFIKVFDEKSKQNSFYITKEEYTEIENGKRVQEFDKRIKNLFDEASKYYQDLFESSDKISLGNSSLGFVVNKLQTMNLTSSSRDVKGLAFQKFIYSKQRSDRGQFFTPEQIIELCVHILKPKSTDIILDPACGSAGFLSQALSYVLENSLSSSSVGDKRKFAEDNLYGIEINKMAAKTAKMRMILDGDGSSNILVTDSLSDWDVVNRELSKSLSKVKSYEGFFDVILTNPPFGTQGKITDRSILKRFNLAHKWDKFDNKFYKTEKTQDGQVPDILFIERCLDLLKDDGRLAIVLPNGDLENSSLQYLRQYILDHAQILAVVKLPSETFIPFGTGVKASILFLRKGHMNKRSKVFFAEVNKIGYQGNKNGSAIYKKDQNGKMLVLNGEPVVDQDISDIINSYNSYEKGETTLSNNCFTIEYDDLASRLDVDYYHPEVRNLEEKLLKENAKRLGEIVEYKKDKPSVLKNAEANVDYVELSDVSAEYSEIVNATNLSVHELPSRAQYMLSEGDLITAVAGNSIGSRKHVSAIVNKEYDSAICTNGFRVIKCKGDIDKHYMLHFFRSESFLKQVMKYRTGAAIPAISDEDFMNILVPIPDKETQEGIAKIIQQSIDLRKQSKLILNKIKL